MYHIRLSLTLSAGPYHATQNGLNLGFFFLHFLRTRTIGLHYPTQLWCLFIEDYNFYGLFWYIVTWTTSSKPPLQIQPPWRFGFQHKNSDQTQTFNPLQNPASYVTILHNSAPLHLGSSEVHVSIALYGLEIAGFDCLHMLKKEMLDEGAPCSTHPIVSLYYSNLYFY